MNLQPQVRQVSLGLQGDDVAGIHQALRTLGRTIPADEADAMVFGPGTVAVVKAFQTDAKVPVTGIVDAATVRAINAALTRLAGSPRVIRGRVTDANGEAPAGLSVEVYVQTPAGESAAGKSALQSDGSYQVSYKVPSGQTRLDVRVEVRDAKTPVDTTPPGTSILTDAGPIEVVDFVLSGPAHTPSSEFERLTAELKPLLGSRAPASLREDATHNDVSLLAVQSGRPAEQVSAFVIANRLASTTKIPAAVMYGLVRQGLPADLAALQATHADVQQSALQSAVANGTVPATIAGTAVEHYLTALTPTASAPLKAVLGTVLRPREIDAFVGAYLKSGDAATFWKSIAADPAFQARAGRLQLIVQLAGLTGNHAPLVGAVLARGDVAQAADLARLTAADWTAMIDAPGIGVPDDVAGANANDTSNAYVSGILTRVEAAFPTPFLAARLEPSPVRTFLEANPSYDLKRTYPAPFFTQNATAGQPPLAAGDRTRLENLQRVYRLTGTANDTLALTAQGITSARQIAQLSRGAFLAQQETVLGADRANAIYNRALRVSALALAVFGDNAASMNRTGLQVLPRLDTDKQAAVASAPIPDWQTLFGSFDACACIDCASVHGPAAYLVDALQFLKSRGVQPALFQRRADLGAIELSCENTETPLPVIDLANEILEDAIVPPPPFSAFTLAAALEADLAQSIATAALAAAFHPPLAAGTRVEEIEPKARWRIWDQPYAYTVIKDGSVLQVATRSRQTGGSAAERRASPQYRNDAAYDVVAQAVYPWSLPFERPSAEANVFLAHLGVPRRDLIEAIRPSPQPFDVNDAVARSLAAEGLGLTDVERRIIAGDALTVPQPPSAFWGSKQVADLTTVSALLEAAGLEYSELEALLDTRFVNPGRAVTLVLDAGALDACDTTKLHAPGLTDDILSRMHRFVRLWRKLAWPASDLDRAICALSSDPGAPVLDDAVLVRLDHLRRVREALRLSVPQALALWRPIDTREPGSLYRSLFFNPAVFPSADAAFALRADGQELAETTALLEDHAAEVQAAFRLDAIAFAQLVARTDNRLTLANLSLLYRHALLARQATLSVPDLLIAIDLTGLDPFQWGATQDLVRFIDIVADVRSSGFDWPQLDYILRHRFSAAASFVPAESTLAQILTDLREALSKADSPRSAAIDRVSAALGLSADVTATLLTRVMHAGVPAMQRLLDVAAIDAAEELSRVNAAPQFETIEKLLKIAAIVGTLGLPGSQLEWLLRENGWLTIAPDPLPNPIAFASWYSIVELRRLRRDLALENGAVEGVLSALTAVSVAADDPGRLAAKQHLIDALSTWLGWPAADVQTFIGSGSALTDTGRWNVSLPNGYRIELLTRLSRAMSTLKRLGVTAADADAWCGPTVSAADAKAIRGKAKSKYDAAAWQGVVTPLQDDLRQRQRDALVAYLSAPPANATTVTEGDADDLYAYFLLDVELCSCQLTSRIKQAIGSVQLFAQRCLMGLEAGVQVTDADWQPWTGWMKSYRVWEANRKIWLYPENWIEPELRDDKTPFYRDLENELQQSDLDSAAAERALMNYLQKLEQVAHLEIAGTYEDAYDDGAGGTIKTLHVFARTYHTPRVYFYRRRDGATQTWTPWEKLDLDIEGDHLIPVVWNRRLMLLWPVFTQKQDETAVKMPAAGQTLGSGAKHWDLQLAWSELQYGRWSGKQLTDPVQLDAVVGNPNVLFGQYVGPLVMARQVGGQPPVSGGGGVGPGGGGTQPPPPNAGAQDAVTTLVSPELMTFKAFPGGDSLTVRGYLRLDYAGTAMGAGPRYAYPFGEFRFTGCRKIVTTAYRGQMINATFALAPQGTTFDAMWFDEAGSGLTMLDGSFPPPRPFVPPPVAFAENVPTPLPQDTSALTTAAINIPVLGSSPSRYRLLPPHQDQQFVGDRPFFYMDGQRTFVVSSTGHSGYVVNPVTWVNADLATLGMAFSAPVPDSGTTVPPAVTSSALTVLVPDARGVRVAQPLTPVDIAPVPTVTKALSRFWSDRAYTFRNFSHPWACAFVQRLEQGGIDSLLSLDAQEQSADTAFSAYAAQPSVAHPYPVDDVDFAYGGAYDRYNWELFFHVPLLIATRLSTNQRFADAQRWFHYIFDPTGSAAGSGAQRFWRAKPFHDRAADDYEQQSVQAIEELAAAGPPASLSAAIELWRNNPFDPYAVARLRTTAFQKTVVMKYIDNLIAWGDQLFRANTIESINEATQLYVLAAGILGRRPRIIDSSVHPPVRTYDSIGELGPLSNALEQIELLVGTDGNDTGGGTGEDGALDGPPKVLYFCVQENDKLVGYWDTVADRLFKIRHCMNIEGQVQQLPLFEPPIDPGLLVRARAAGLSIAEVLSDVAAPIPNYRFSVMLQKASDLTAEVRSLGAQLLAALEKKDAESLSTLRSGQELQLLQAVRDVRARQADEAARNVEALQQSQDMAQARADYYSSREFMNAQETASQALTSGTVDLITQSGMLRFIAGQLASLGTIKIGSPTTAGMDIGFDYVARSLEVQAGALDATSSTLNVRSQLASRLAEYQRRQDDWAFQADLARREVKQIDKQLAAAQIRAAIAEQERANHDLQIDHARAVDDVLKGKFTNGDLYQWMIGQVSALYFEGYQLAYDLAKRAERCLQYELGLEDGGTSFVRFGDWDSLKKGLLAGDRLAHDLKRLDAAYLDLNAREYELTKHVSLVSLAPEQLIALKETGRCTFDVPEWLFDLDTPGHFRRRLKMVSVTIPCVVGPYTTIHCKVQLVKSSYRQSTDVSAGYERLPPDTPDSRFVDDRRVVSDMVTSTAQNDAGLFEPSMRDERYLPFEGAGAVSTWQLELSNEFHLFDYATITDVILHLRYTARQSDTLRDPATAAAKNRLADASATPLLRLFSLRHEFPNEWHRFVNAPQSATTAITVNLAKERFPYFVQGRTIAIRQATVVARATAGPPPQCAIAPGTTPPSTSDPAWSGNATPGPWTVSIGADPRTVQDVFVVLSYTA